MREMWKMAYGRMQIEFIRPVGCYICEELGHFARDCPKLFELKNVGASTGGGREDASRGRAADLDNFRSLWLEVEQQEGRSGTYLFDHSARCSTLY
ncbi:hypothetical protein HPP92_017134 [Vanilla planifolia]|uniref:CCHC-type domain-containing protein n=1 Tax=Vanilla planifolia TaxID=51239 RepID=A0A835QBN9_VANPL|nr:hypothetical protein HPP92_017134 [Vanilla planifolia]